MGYKNRVNFENRYFNPQGGYGQTLLGYGQAYNKIQKLLVKMTICNNPRRFLCQFPKKS